MNTTYRQVVLGLSILLGLFVGGWAAFFPRAFYDDFPGATLAWVSVDVVGNVVSLSVSLAFGIILLLPYRTPSPAAAGEKVAR
ncbi:hypothetical protein OG394_07450 [Kribbella sp. NBC_01245]|uniref:hypothetical protein n=1 Tax=Kribbella sp. NBC_01245 TaxID=2903578 RepID=UPI002E2C639B|nr:hypothetical protein [Kribbella sp. NBC_01245]